MGETYFKLLGMGISPFQMVHFSSFTKGQSINCYCHFNYGIQIAESYMEHVRKEYVRGTQSFLNSDWLSFLAI